MEWWTQNPLLVFNRVHLGWTWPVRQEKTGQCSREAVPPNEYTETSQNEWQPAAHSHLLQVSDPDWWGRWRSCCCSQRCKAQCFSGWEPVSQREAPPTRPRFPGDRGQWVLEFLVGSADPDLLIHLTAATMTKRVTAERYLCAKSVGADFACRHWHWFSNKSDPK